MGHLERYRAAVERVRALAASESPKAIADLDRAIATSREGARDTALAAQLGLSADEVMFLWTVVAVSTDPRLVEQARGATLAFHVRIYRLAPEAATGLGLSLGPAHPLLRHRLLVASDPRTPAIATWQAPHRVAAYLAGDDTLDPALLEAGERVRVPDGVMIDDRNRPQLEQIGRALAGGEVIVVLDGPAGAGRRTSVAVAARRLERAVVALDLEQLAPGDESLDRGLEALVREARLTGAVPVVANLEARPGPAALRRVTRALDGVPGPCAVTTILAGVELGARKPEVRIAIPVPPTSTRRTLWDRLLGEDAPAVGEVERNRIATRFRLGPGGIERSLAAARLIAAGRGEGLTTEALLDGIRLRVTAQMGRLAVRAPRRGRDLPTLPPAQLEALRALAVRMRDARPAGVIALFSGPSGSGKTMAAEKVASQLDRELYVVDVADLVHPELELARLFDAADAGNALLLFDDADALLARRGEVRHLLSRVDAFGGLAILTAAADTVVDPWILARLGAHLRFQGPGAGAPAT